MKSEDKRLQTRAEKSMTAFETALLTAAARRKHRSLTLCGTAAGVVAVVGQHRAANPGMTLRDFFDRLPWGTPC